MTFVRRRFLEERLTEALRRVEPGGVVRLVGRPGVGKTTLIEHRPDVAARLARRGGRFEEVRADVHTGGAPCVEVPPFSAEETEAYLVLRFGAPAPPEDLASCHRVSGGVAGVLEALLDRMEEDEMLAVEEDRLVFFETPEAVALPKRALGWILEDEVLGATFPRHAERAKDDGAEPFDRSMQRTPWADRLAAWRDAVDEGKADAAAEAIEAARDDILRETSPPFQVTALTLGAQAAGRAGRYETAERFLGLAEEIATAYRGAGEADADHLAWRVAGSRAWLLARRGAREEAERAAREILEAARGEDLAVERSVAHAVLARVHEDGGNLEEAVRAAGRALAEVSAGGPRRAEVQLRYRLGRLLAKAGRTRQAAEVLDRARAEAEALGLSYLAGLARRVAEEEIRPESPARRPKPSTRRAAQPPGGAAQPPRGAAQPPGGTADASWGEVERWEDAIRHGGRSLRRGDATARRRLDFLLRDLGRAKEAKGDRVGAERAYRRRWEVVRAPEHPLRDSEVHARRDLGRVLAGRGNPEAIAEGIYHLDAVGAREELAEALAAWGNEAAAEALRSASRSAAGSAAQPPGGTAQPPGGADLSRARSFRVGPVPTGPLHVTVRGAPPAAQISLRAAGGRAERHAVEQQVAERHAAGDSAFVFDDPRRGFAAVVGLDLPGAYGLSTQGDSAAAIEAALRAASPAGIGATPSAREAIAPAGGEWVPLRDGSFRFLRRPPPRGRRSARGAFVGDPGPDPALHGAGAFRTAAQPPGGAAEAFGTAAVWALLVAAVAALSFLSAYRQAVVLIVE